MMYSGTGNVSSHLAGSSSSAAGDSGNPTFSYPFIRQEQVRQPLMIPLPPPTLPSLTRADDDDDFPRRDERFPQWSNQETRDFIEIRAQLEWSFTSAEMNKNLWEMVASRMREKGYRRPADHCKSKWNNLVTSYKEQEASSVDNVGQCPFFNELHAAFTVMSNIMQQKAQVEAETGVTKGSRKRLQTISEDQPHQEFIDQEQEDEEQVIEVKEAINGRVVPKRQKTGEKENKNEILLNGLGEIMRSFFAQQQMIDMQWRESIEKRAEERERFEQEWRHKMENLERESLMMERAWREREEQRRLRDESRAERRDALLTALLNKLIKDE